MKAKSHHRASEQVFFCYRCRRYQHGKPALKTKLPTGETRLLCGECKEEGM
jgi:hypothetical protein